MFKKVKIEELNLYVLVLIPLSMPFSIKITSALIIILSVLWLLSGNFKNKYLLLKQRPLLIIFIVFYAVYIFGLIYTDNFPKGIRNLEKKLSFLILPIVIGTSTYKLNKTQLNYILNSFIGSVFIATLICFINGFYSAIVLKPEGRSVNWDNVSVLDFQSKNPSSNKVWDYFTYIEFTRVIAFHPTYFALYIAFSLFAVYFLITKNYSRWARIGAYFLIIYFSFILILLSARIIIFSVIFITLILLILYFKRKKKLLIGTLIIPLSMLMLYGILNMVPTTKYRLFQQFENFSFNIPDKDHWDPTNIRLGQWYCSIKIIKENPIIGVGTGDTQDKLQHCYQEIDFGAYRDVFYNSHSQYLQTTVTSGIVGFILLIVTFCLPLFRTKNKTYFILIILFAFSCLTESMLEANKGIIFFTFFSSLFIAFQYNSVQEYTGSQILPKSKNE